MKTLPWKLYALTLGLILTVAACSSPSNEPDPNQELVLHNGTGLEFPFEHTGFTRSAIENAEDQVIVDYYFERLDDTVIANISVWPKNGITIQEKVEEIKSEFNKIEKDPEYRFIATYDIPLAQGKQLFNGKKVYFRISDGVFANVFVVEYKDYFVQYSVHFPRDLDRVAEAFVNDYKWAPEIEQTKAE